MQKHTEWHDVTVWGKMAEHCAHYLAKGSKVYVEGGLRTEKYENAKHPGVEFRKTRIVAESVNFLDRRETQPTPAHDPGQRVRGGDATSPPDQWRQAPVPADADMPF